jgi:C-terminal processing protease CtpA/Prc
LSFEIIAGHASWFHIPKNHFQVNNLHKDGLAFQSGVEIGDKVMSVNGKMVASMTGGQKEFMSCMKARPLKVTLCRRSARGEEEGEE